MRSSRYKVPFGWKVRKFFVSLGKKFNLIMSHKRHIEILKQRGLKVGEKVIIDPNVVIDGNFAFLVSIGDNSTINAGVRILAHDNSMFLHTGGYGRIAPVTIKENCIIGSDSVILPGVTIGPNVIVAAGSVVNKDIPPNTCVAGVPARYYSKYDDLIEKYKDSIEKGFVVSGRKVLTGKTDEKTRKLIMEKLDEGQEVFLSDLYELSVERDMFD